MLQSPHIVKEKLCSIDDLYAADDNYVKVHFPEFAGDEHWARGFINNQIVKAIIEKYPNKKGFFQSISFHEDEELNFDRALFGTGLYRDIQEEFGSIDIFFMDYHRIGDAVKKHLNTLIRVGCVCSSGKLLFHIVSARSWLEHVREGYFFDTYCDEEKLLLGHEIQQLNLFNEIWIDDTGFSKI